MKHLLFLAFFLAGWTTSFGQSYVPFLQNIGWCVEHYVGTGSVMTGYSRTGDTAIGPFTYAKLAHDNNMFLVREDVVTRKVWVILPDSTSEVLLYDFDPSAGPDVILNYVGYGPVTYLIVSRDSIMTPLGMRELIILSTADTVFASDLNWIQGIGSGYGPVYLFDPTYAPGMVSSGHCLICSYTDIGVQSYAGVCGVPCIPYPGSACYDFMTGVENVQSEEAPLTIRIPSNQLILINSRKDLIREVKVFRIDGKLMDRDINISSFEFRLNTGGWLPGLYLIEVTMDDGTRFLRKIFRTS